MFYTERNGGRGFNRVKPNSIRGEKGRQPFCCEWFGTQSQMLQTMRHPQVFRGGPVLISPVLLLCARFFMSHILSVTKVPCRSLIFPCKSYQFQNTHGVLRRCLEEVDSICLGFFFSFFLSVFLSFFWGAGHAIQTSMWIHKHLLLMKKIPKKVWRNMERKSFLVCAICRCQLRRRRLRNGSILRKGTIRFF